MTPNRDTVVLAVVGPYFIMATRPARRLGDIFILWDRRNFEMKQAAQRVPSKARRVQSESKRKIVGSRPRANAGETLEAARELVRLHSDLEKTLRALSTAKKPIPSGSAIDIGKLVERLSDAKRKLERRIARLAPVPLSVARGR